MSYFPNEMPVPHPTIDDREFWEYCQKGELRFQSCGACGRVRQPPRPLCPHCLSEKSVWISAPDEALLHSFTIVHQVAFEGVRSVVPYNVAIVRYPSLENVRLISNVLDATAADLRFDMPLRLVWDEQGGMKLPRYRIV